MTPIITAALNIILLVEEVIASGTWYAAIDLANAFFSIPIWKNYQKQFSFTFIPSQRCLRVMSTLLLFDIK